MIEGFIYSYLAVFVVLAGLAIMAILSKTVSELFEIYTRQDVAVLVLYSILPIVNCLVLVLFIGYHCMRLFDNTPLHKR